MNSKKLAIVAILGLLVLGGAAFGLYTKKMNVEGFRGIGFSVSGLEQEKVDEWIGAFETVLTHDDVLAEIVSQSEYSAKLGVPEGEAVAHLRNVVDVNQSEVRKTIQIGLRGKRKYNTELDNISRAIFNVAAPLVAQAKPEFGRHYQSLQTGQ